MMPSMVPVTDRSDMGRPVGIASNWFESKFSGVSAILSPGLSAAVIQVT